MFKVLVVDDDRDLRSTVGSALSESSHEVDYASDGEEAVNRVRARKYDLVLLDPPYAMSATAVERLLEDLGDHLRDGALVVLERGKRSDPVTWPSGYEIVAEKAYSQTRITIALW